MKRIILYSILAFCPSILPAQERLWSLNDCMKYAVENSPALKRAAYTYDSYKAEQLAAVGAFLPSVTVASSLQYNFGRAVDPETNTYVNTTTFNNYYEGGASMPLFRGGQLVNQWRLAKANRQMGLNDIQKAKDDLALNTMEAYVNVAYYKGTIKFATEKLVESNRNLIKVKREEELGLKGKADVAQIEALVAGDDYMLMRQQNLYTTAMLQLKDYMNYPYDEELLIDTATLVVDYPTPSESVDEIFGYAMNVNPDAVQSDFLSQTARLRYLMQKGRLLPSLSLSAGIYTSYFENLKAETMPTPFRTQFSNNRGEYISVSLRIPILDGFAALTDVRRARNNMKIANEQRSETLRKLQTAIEQSVADRDGFAKESVQMEKKLKADEIAYRLTLRKFEEGLMSSIELQTSANSLLESKANLLQRQLMFLLKSRQVEYYKGRPLID